HAAEAVGGIHVRGEKIISAGRRAGADVVGETTGGRLIVRGGIPREHYGVGVGGHRQPSWRTGRSVGDGRVVSQNLLRIPCKKKVEPPVVVVITPRRGASIRFEQPGRDQ